MIKPKQIEIFCGTGGVGKTTLATSRALQLCKKNKKILLITIDPSKRLKQILNINNSEVGEIKQIPIGLFTGRISQEPKTFDALLMSPAKTLERVGRLNKTTTDLENPIIKILTRPYGGMNEIMSILEVQFHLQENKYDSIILDTPPGNNFLDFLKSSEKISRFFDKSFIEVFKYLHKPLGAQNNSDGIIKSLVSMSIKKLLSYLERVTGKKFIQNFLDAISAIYKSKDSFLNALKFQDNLKKEEFTNWFLVTSIEQQKINEATQMYFELKDFAHDSKYLIVNKCIGPHVRDWDETITCNDVLKQFKDTMEKRENKIISNFSNLFHHIFQFPEVLEEAPEKHVHELSKFWNN